VKNAKSKSLKVANFPPRPTHFPPGGLSATQFSCTYQDGSIILKNMPHEGKHVIYCTVLGAFPPILESAFHFIKC